MAVDGLGVTAFDNDDAETASSPRADAAEAVSDAVPFVMVPPVWFAVMLLFDGVFLATRPSGVSYEPWVFASVFVIPGVAFVGHVLKQAIHGSVPSGRTGPSRSPAIGKGYPGLSVWFD